MDLLHCFFGFFFIKNLIILLSFLFCHWFLFWRHPIVYLNKTEPTNNRDKAGPTAYSTNDQSQVSHTEGPCVSLVSQYCTKSGIFFFNLCKNCYFLLCQSLLDAGITWNSLWKWIHLQGMHSVKKLFYLPLLKMFTVI